MQQQSNLSNNSQNNQNDNNPMKQQLLQLQHRQQNMLRAQQEQNKNVFGAPDNGAMNGGMHPNHFNKPPPIKDQHHQSQSYAQGINNNNGGNKLNNNINNHSQSQSFAQGMHQNNQPNGGRGRGMGMNPNNGDNGGHNPLIDPQQQMVNQMDPNGGGIG